MKSPKKKLAAPKSLVKRVKLNADQYERATGGATEGQASVYVPDGNNYIKSLPRIRGLAKARNKQPRFALFTDQIGKRLYVGNEGLTFDKKEALVFYEGFDDPSKKAAYFAFELSKGCEYPFRFEFQTTKI